MYRKFQIFIGCALIPAVAGPACAAAVTQLGAVSIRVSRKAEVTRNVGISIRPTRHLPAGGYYYAVLVLKRYKHYSAAAPPPCASSSDMSKTAYGYPQPGHSLPLKLTPAASIDNRWCPGGTYMGAVYAVPHKPSCAGSYSCNGNNPPPSPCWQVNGHVVCGVVARPQAYPYLGGLPKPIDHSTRIVGRFQVVF